MLKSPLLQCPLPERGGGSCPMALAHRPPSRPSIALSLTGRFSNTYDRLIRWEALMLDLPDHLVHVMLSVVKPLGARTASDPWRGSG